MPNCDGAGTSAASTEDPAFATVPVVLVTAAGFQPRFDAQPARSDRVSCPKPIQPAELLGRQAMRLWQQVKRGAAASI